MDASRSPGRSCCCQLRLSPLSKPKCSPAPCGRFLGGGEDHFTQTIGTCGAAGRITDYYRTKTEANGSTVAKAITSCQVAPADRQACPLHTLFSANTSTSEADTLCQAGVFANCAFDAGADITAPSLACYQCKAPKYTAFDFNDAAVGMIRDHAQHRAGRPLFMYLALHNTHGPIEAPPEYESLYHFKLKKRNVFNGMVSVVDSTVANVTAALKDTGMWENTLFIWTTDNGSPVQVAGSNDPFRGRSKTDFSQAHCPPHRRPGEWNLNTLPTHPSTHVVAAE